MPIIELKGTWTALITPFKDDNSADFEGLKKNIEFQINQGVTGILAVGTTGESPTLSNEEHISVLEKAKQFAGDKCGVLGGTGSNSTHKALSLCKHALDSGIDKVLLVDCYYNGPSSLELRDEYYKTILDEYKDIKIVIYVIPGRTGTAISTVDITVLSEEYDRVVAIKEATGDLNRMEEERTLMPDMSILSGDDDKTYEMMSRKSIRASGVISVITNIAPKAVKEMVDELLSGNVEKAGIIARKLKPLFSIVTVKAKSKRVLSGGREIMVENRFRNPLAIKTVMNALGVPAGSPRKPLGKMTIEGIQVVRNALKKVYEDAPEILKPLEDFYKVDVEKRIYDDSAWATLMY